MFDNSLEKWEQVHGTRVGKETGAAVTTQAHHGTTEGHGTTERRFRVSVGFCASVVCLMCSF